MTPFLLIHSRTTNNNLLLHSMEEDTMDLHNIALNDQEEEEGEESVSSTFDHADLSDSSAVRLATLE